MTESLGLYIAVPFCKGKCTYCNFASGVFPASEHARYVKRVCAEVRRARAEADRSGCVLPERVGSIYLGGGTPSTLAPQMLRDVFACIRSEFAGERSAEITVECAPGQIGAEFLQVMVEVSVTRVSLGVQTFVDAEARATGRFHTRKDVSRDMERLREAGIRNLSVDLIAGMPGQTMASWRDSLQVLASTGVEHASVYMLEVDEDSRLGRELIGGGARYAAGLVPSDDAVAAMYEEACAFLESQGLRQYEISNFARAGCESAHNRRYWMRQAYLGVGLDASSMLRTHAGRAVRWTNTDDLREYVQGSGESPERRLLACEEELEEAWFLGLRLNEGVSIAALEREFGSDAVANYAPVVERLISDGLLMRAGERVRLTARGRMVSNDVFAEFLLGELTAAQT